MPDGRHTCEDGTRWQCSGVQGLHMMLGLSETVALAADTKRLKGQEIMKDSYLTYQATSFAGRKAEQRLEEAQRVRLSLHFQRLQCPVLLKPVRPT